METLSLPKIMFFELGIISTPSSSCNWEKILTRQTPAEAQLLLVALRGEVDQISDLGPGGSLESLFGTGLVCYIDDRESFSQCSTTSSAVGIKRLATTATAAAASGTSIVAPALDGIQLDGFIDQRRPSCTIQDLAEVDVSFFLSSIIMAGTWLNNHCNAVQQEILELCILDHYVAQLG